jgi:hypothetical protein
MTKNWIAINLLLLSVVGLLGWRLSVSVFRFNEENNLAKIRPVNDPRQKKAPEKPLPQPSVPKILNSADFAVVPEKNIFSESRAREDKTDVAAIPETPPLAQKPILVGVTLTGDQKLASIIEPMGGTPGQNRRTQTKRIGDVYQGYAITEITLDHIVLESGTRKEIIPLHEGSKRSQGGKTPILSTRVVAIGGGSYAGAGAPATVISGSVPGVARPTPAPAPAQSSVVVAPGQPAGGRATTTGQARVNPAATPQPQQTAPAQQQAPAQGGRNVIRTPFGDIIRPNP